MKQQTVALTVELNLCCSCGMCKAICPKHCISTVKKNGMFQPYIDEDKCIECGLCSEICPGLTHIYNQEEIDENEAIKGKVIRTCNAWSKDDNIRHVSASGGVVSTIVKELLDRDLYDAAFLLDSYDYRNQVLTQNIIKDDYVNVENSDFPKSRYLPVSHENAIDFIKRNRDKKVIFVGVSCAVRGFLNVVEKLDLNRENYLVIGLFCDKVFNYNVLDYFNNKFSGSKNEIIGLHFKNKESGGWPGNMKLFYSDGSAEYIENTERMKVKEYFMPERCMYCIDKINVNADISVGDNFTEQNSSILGSNSVIVRTNRGNKAWDKSCSKLEYEEITIGEILKAQNTEGRLNNLKYAKIKEDSVEKKIKLNTGLQIKKIDRDIYSTWKNNLTKIKSGEIYDTNPEVLHGFLRKYNREARIKHVKWAIIEPIYVLGSKIKKVILKKKTLDSVK